MSASRPTFLDTDSSVIENNLRFVKDEFEEEFNNIFTPVMEQAQSLSRGESKIVQPDPGFCIKTFKVENNEKLFVNICHTNAIPPPEDITEDQLLAILNDGVPSSFKIPMSITPARPTKDKSGKLCHVCDIAINNQFFNKIENGGLMRDFLITVIFEGINNKYNIQINESSWNILHNRKCFDKLIAHNIQNRDVKNVLESYKNPTDNDREMLRTLEDPNQVPGKKLIEEIDDVEAKKKPSKIQEKPKAVTQSPYVPNPVKLAVSQANTRKPDYRLFREPADGKAKLLVGEFYLPECVSSKEITLDIGEDRIFIEARKHGYLLDAFVDYLIDTDHVKAQFNKESGMLKVTFSVM